VGVVRISHDSGGVQFITFRPGAVLRLSGVRLAVAISSVSHAGLPVGS
jgi:hypothetical protein